MTPLCGTSSLRAPGGRGAAEVPPARMRNVMWRRLVVGVLLVGLVGGLLVYPPVRGEVSAGVVGGGVSGVAGGVVAGGVVADRLSQGVGGGVAGRGVDDVAVVERAERLVTERRVVLGSGEGLGCLSGDSVVGEGCVVSQLAPRLTAAAACAGVALL